MHPSVYSTTKQSSFVAPDSTVSLQLDCTILYAVSRTIALRFMRVLDYFIDASLLENKGSNLPATQLSFYETLCFATKF